MLDLLLHKTFAVVIYQADDGHYWIETSKGRFTVDAWDKVVKMFDAKGSKYFSQKEEQEAEARRQETMKMLEEAEEQEKDD